MQRVLTLLDATGIQDYVFGSNRLRENVVASYLVELATGAWMTEALQQHAPDHYQLIFCGGGNVAFLSTDLAEAKQVISAVTRRVLIEAPGLSFTAAHFPFDDTVKAIGGPDGAYVEVVRKLATHSQQRRNTLALPGLAVTRVCRSTGQPAVSVDEEEPDRPVSAEVEAKTRRKRRDAADKRLHNFLTDPQAAARVAPNVLERYAFSRELDDLGRSRGESSYIAVIHADGNGMGQRFQDLIARYPTPGDNAQCVDAIRAFSDALESAGRTALQRTLHRMITALNTPAFDDLRASLVATVDGHHYLPLRPIVFGGDDMTLVCDGRLGLTFAAAYLEEFQHAAAHLPDGKPGYACAGVAIVKTPYPFARAYALATELCDAAKDLVRREAKKRAADGHPTPFDASALDWHIAVNGIAAPLDELRKRFSTAHFGGRLWHRPLYRDGLGWEAWDSLTNTIAEFRRPEWQERQNKVIALREALRHGPDATHAFRVAFGMDQLPSIIGAPERKPDEKPDEAPDAGYRHTGWVDSTCAYFDAIEALDFYQPLPAAEDGR